MKKEVKDILILIIVSIIFSLIYQYVIVNIYEMKASFSIDVSIIIALIMTFIGLHFVFGLKRLYDFIINHRYKIALVLVIVFTLLNYSGSSIGIFSGLILEDEKNNTVFGTYRRLHSDEYAIETLGAISQYANNFSYTNNLLRGTATDVFSVLHIPVKDIVSVGKIFNVGYYFLNSGTALALWWNLKLFSLILVSFELCMLITNKNKYISLIGSVMIAISGAVQWWFSTDILFFGQLAIVLVDKFLNTAQLKIKICCAVGIIISAVSYLFTFYPAWIISFGYVFLALFIWIVLKNRKIYKANIKDILIILASVIIALLILFRYYSLSGGTIEIIKNTVYPGARIETGGGGLVYLFSYLFNFLLPFKQTVDNASFASIISLFPIPLIFSLVYLYKKGKHAMFLFPLVAVTVVETIFCISGFPEIVSKLTLFKFVTVERCAVAVGLASLYMMLYIISNIEEELFKFKYTMRITLVIMCFTIFIKFPEAFVARGYLYLFAGILCMLTFLFLNYTDKKYKKVLLTVLVMLTLISGATVNPITKGTSVVTSTNIAKKIQEIVKADEDAIWVGEGYMPFVSNYMVANGAKTLTSTNTYPNMEFYKIVLGEEKLKETELVWNRYASICMHIGLENNIDLMSNDLIEIYVSAEKLIELGVKYIVSYNKAEYLESKGIELKTIYENELSEERMIDGKIVTGIYIYEVM